TALALGHLDHTLRRIDLAIRTGRSELAALRVSTDVATRAARTQIDLADRHREAGRTSVPVREMLWIGERRPDERARCVERARDDELAVVRHRVVRLVSRGRGGRVTSSRHSSPPT